MIHCAIVIVVTVLFLILYLLFSCSATQPQVWNKTPCLSVSILKEIRRNIATSCQYFAENWLICLQLCEWLQDKQPEWICRVDILTLWHSLLPFGYSYRAYCARPGYTVICNFWLTDTDAQGWASECPDVKNYKWTWNEMLYSCTHVTTVCSKGLTCYQWRCMPVCNRRWVSGWGLVIWWLDFRPSTTLCRKLSVKTYSTSAGESLSSLRCHGRPWAGRWPWPWTARWPWPVDDFEPVD